METGARRLARVGEGLRATFSKRGGISRCKQEAATGEIASETALDIAKNAGKAALLTRPSHLIRIKSGAG